MSRTRLAHVTDHTLLDLIRQGGWVLYPLLLCSIASVTVVIERTWALARDARQARRLQQLLDESWDAQNTAEAVAICRRDTSPLGPVYLAAVTSPSADPNVQARIAQRRLSEASRRLRRFVWLLGTIGSL